MIETVPAPAYRQASFSVSDAPAFKEKTLAWMSSFEHCCWLDSNQYPQQTHASFDWLAGAGAVRNLTLESPIHAFEALKRFFDQNPSWLLGYLSYDLKNDTEALVSENEDALSFPALHFFQPAVLLHLKDGQLTIHSTGETPERIFEEIGQTQTLPPPEMPEALPLPVQQKISREEYLQIVEKLRQHIIAGDIYEVNFCQEFFAQPCSIDPRTTFQRFNALSQAPFAAFFRQSDHYLLCASPERFLKKEGDLLVSQPIKGTIRRGQTIAEDQMLRQQLLHSEKDRAENVMIVDLVRNDLARSCLPGTVQVEELFGIYPFAQVFQMISTVRGKLAPDVHFLEALKRAFPMGSMTGAPKVMSMKLIEQYEQSRRGLYSGAVGYLTPEGDFDFNVVIRSILYNASNQYLSFQVGGAIVYDSVPEQEYEECLLKAKAMLEVLGQSRGLTENPRLHRSSQKAG